ncbi:hypothetical protein CP533_1455 [Ophiocordyceps camponoti-saundersi (nom. inval.)]|nr:hypothetical protein CP533_1455 [Ophiocordyceps camponoti-saundersi (nom. inval.)]
MARIRSRRRRRIHLLLPISILLLTTPKAKAQSTDNSKCAETFHHCSGFDPGFCCPKDSVCVPLAGQTTVLCCPEGRSCDVIKPITCDVREQDPVKKPQAPLKTKLLGVELSTCGAIIGGTIGAILAALLILTAIIILLRRRKSRPSSSSSLKTDNDRPKGQVISAPLLNHPSSTASSYRTDFLRPKQPSSTLSPWTFPTTPVPAANSSSSSFIPNPFSSPAVGPGPYPRSPTGNPARSSITSFEEMTARTGHVAGGRLAPIRTMKPSNFRRSRHLHHQHSSESIDVFADADVASVPPPSANAFHHDANRDTSLTAMMEQAGLGDLRRGRPFVPGTTPRI